MPAMARALELLPSMDFPRSGTLVPELARLNKLLIEEQKEFWENVAKPKDQRRAGLTKEYMETTQGLLDVLDNLGNTLAATVNHQDAEIDQLLSIKQNAWLLRNTAGEGFADRLDRDLPPARSRRKPATTIPNMSAARARCGRRWNCRPRACSCRRRSPPPWPAPRPPISIRNIWPCVTASRTRWSRARRPR